MVRLSASAFMCATISTSPLPASVATQVTSPSASNFGVSVKLSSFFEVSATAGSNVSLHPEGASKASLEDDRERLPLSAAHGRQETKLLVRIVADRAAELGGHRQRAGLFDAAQRHAGVLGLDHHRDAARLEDFFHRGGDLGVH